MKPIEQYTLNTSQGPVEVVGWHTPKRILAARKRERGWWTLDHMGLGVSAMSNAVPFLPSKAAAIKVAHQLEALPLPWSAKSLDEWNVDFSRVPKPVILELRAIWAAVSDSQR